MSLVGVIGVLVEDNGDGVGVGGAAVDKNLVILVSSSALSKQAEALHFWSLILIF